MGSLRRRIEEFILSKISSGEYPPGSKIPTEMELQKLFGVSRITVRSALEGLKERGILVSRAGRGTFVNPGPGLFGGAQGFSLSLLPIESLGAKVLEFKRVRPPGSIRDELRMGDGKTFFLFDLRLEGEDPVSICRSYLPCSRVPGFLPRDGSMADALFSFGVKVAFASLRIDQARAQARDAKLLRLKTGYPLLRVKRVLYTRLGEPVCHSVFLIKGEVSSLSFCLGGSDGIHRWPYKGS